MSDVLATHCTLMIWWLLGLGQKNLNCCKKDQISVCSLLVTPFCGVIMNVLTCGESTCALLHERALWAQKKALKSKGTNSWEWWLCWQRLPFADTALLGVVGADGNAGDRPGCQQVG